MTSTVRVTPGIWISRYKVVWRVVEVSTELREIHARRRSLSNRDIGMFVRKHLSDSRFMGKDPPKFREVKLTVDSSRG